MIIITLKNNSQFKYRGKIEITFRETCLSIDATIQDEFSKVSWEGHSFDMFWLEYIHSIIGTDE